MKLREFLEKVEVWKEDHPDVLDEEMFVMVYGDFPKEKNETGEIEASAGVDDALFDNNCEVSGVCLISQEANVEAV